MVTFFIKPFTLREYEFFQITDKIITLALRSYYEASNFYCEVYCLIELGCTNVTFYLFMMTFLAEVGDVTQLSSQILQRMSLISTILKGFKCSCNRGYFSKILTYFFINSQFLTKFCFENLFSLGKWQIKHVLLKFNKYKSYIYELFKRVLK